MIQLREEVIQYLLLYVTHLEFFLGILANLGNPGTTSLHIILADTLTGSLINLCEMIGQDINNTIVICDYYNDRELMRVGGIKVVVADAPAEIRAMGRHLGLPAVLIDKIPSDGLSGMSDEDKLGFTYEVLDKYIRTGEIEDPATKERIDSLHKKNLFKLRFMDCFKYEGVEVKADE